MEQPFKTLLWLILVIRWGLRILLKVSQLKTIHSFVTSGPDADAGILPRSLDVIFSSIGEHGFAGISIKPQRCREFTRLTVEQQAEEELFKRNLFRQLQEVSSCTPASVSTWDLFVSNHVVSERGCMQSVVTSVQVKS